MLRGVRVREDNYEALYRSLFQQNRDAVIYFNKTTIIDANQAALALFEATIDEFIGKEIHEYTDDREQAIERADKRSHGISGSYTSEIKTKHGIKEIEVVSTPVNTGNIQWIWHKDQVNLTEATRFWRQKFLAEPRWKPNLRKKKRTWL